MELNALVNNTAGERPGSGGVVERRRAVLGEPRRRRKALSFAERASDIDDQHVTAHVTKGYLSLKCKRATPRCTRSNARFNWRLRRERTPGWSRRI